jgi:hypothetical protein
LVIAAVGIAGRTDLSRVQILDGPISESQRNDHLGFEGQHRVDMIVGEG